MKALTGLVSECCPVIIGKIRIAEAKRGVTDVQTRKMRQAYKTTQRTERRLYYIYSKGTTPPRSTDVEDIDGPVKVQNKWPASLTDICPSL